MAPKELPPQVAERMMMRGAAVAFGPDYLENSLLMRKEMGGALAGMAFLSCEKIDDLSVPDGPVLVCAMTFFHRLPPGMDLGAWDTALLKDVALTSQPPKGLGVADKSPENPNVELVPVGGNELQLIVTWLRPLEAAHIVAVARALERSYTANGGQYDPPGLFKRLRDLLP